MKKQKSPFKLKIFLNKKFLNSRYFNSREKLIDYKDQIDGGNYSSIPYKLVNNRFKRLR